MYSPEAIILVLLLELKQWKILGEFLSLTSNSLLKWPCFVKSTHPQQRRAKSRGCKTGLVLVPTLSW